MIISASRRTDIPAFYGEWLVQRLREGLVLVRNPMNCHQVAKLALSPETVECLVFWTKNPAPLLARLAEIDALGYRYYFLMTLTPYDWRVEAQVPAVETRIAAFQALAGTIGRDRVIWRYDPILLTDRYSTEVHAAAFAKLAERLAGHTGRCIVSFVEMYRKSARNMRGLKLVDPPIEARSSLVRTLGRLAEAHGISLQTCAAGGELAESGIPSGKCIDDALVATITGAPIRAAKDKNQRGQCGCIESIDIGAYDSCPHGCLYCYANRDQKAVARNCAAHRPDSPLLYGTIQSGDRITERTIKPLTCRQGQLF